MKYLLVIPVLLLLSAVTDVYGQYTKRGDDIREAVRSYGQAEVIISYPGFEAMTQTGRTLLSGLLRRHGGTSQPLAQ